MGHRKKTAPAMKTLLLICAGGTKRKVTVPADWKITFGAIASKPSEMSRYDGARGWCLRIYDGTMPKVVFTDVISFREESVDVQVMVTRTEQKRMDRETPTGRKQGVAEMRYSEWRNAEDTDVDGDIRFLEAEASGRARSRPPLGDF
jgi:hypothetical protein